ncbi:hypothetical protein HDA41_004835 [Streptomyces caelestis]|uniref:Uncharacterized protein n=1 Tax=Streptomyces caelestis TaxID=36816 RepID=A0A7W9LUN9_9ACTN|nr:hypothetical protein [Streptomyces caelestis]
MDGRPPRGQRQRPRRRTHPGGRVPPPRTAARPTRIPPSGCHPTPRPRAATSSNGRP